MGKAPQQSPQNFDDVEGIAVTPPSSNTALRYAPTFVPGRRSACSVLSAPTPIYRPRVTTKPVMLEPLILTGTCLCF